MGNSPVDKGEDFIKSGMKLITDPASDKLLEKIKYEYERTRLGKLYGNGGHK